MVNPPGGGPNTPRRTRGGAPGASGHIGRGGAPRSGTPARNLPGEEDLTPSQEQYWSGFGSSPVHVASVHSAQAAPAHSTPLAASLQTPRYRNMGLSLGGYAAFAVFSGREIGVFYNWPTTKAVTAGDEHACWKGFFDHAGACNAWYEWVRDGTLPQSLHSRYNSTRHPPLQPPPTDDMAIAGHHRTLGTTSNNDVSPAVTVHLHATTTIQNPVTPVRSQRQATPSTPLRHGEPSTPSRHASRHAESPGPSRVATSEAPTVIADEQPLYWVIIAGKEPGVYNNQDKAEEAIGDFGAPMYYTADSYSDGCCAFTEAYMNFDVARFS